MTFDPPASAAPLHPGLALQLRRVVDDTGPDPGAAEMLAALDDIERLRAARFSTSARSAAFVTGRYFLRLMTAKAIGTDPRRLRTDFSCPQCRSHGRAADHGRPGFSLDGEHLPLALSLSRSSGFVLLGVLDLCRPMAQGEGRPAARGLGLDLEAVDAVQFEGFDDVALSPAEKKRIHLLPPKEQLAARARLWVRKEAVVKARGTGFGPVDPSAVDVVNSTATSYLEDISACDGVELAPLGLVAAVAVQ